jgi:hypothetical protein
MVLNSVLSHSPFHFLSPPLSAPSALPPLPLSLYASTLAPWVRISPVPLSLSLSLSVSLCLSLSLSLSVRIYPVLPYRPLPTVARWTDGGGSVLTVWALDALGPLSPTQRTRLFYGNLKLVVCARPVWQAAQLLRENAGEEATQRARVPLFLSSRIALFLWSTCSPVSFLSHSSEFLVCISGPGVGSTPGQEDATPGERSMCRRPCAHDAPA